MAKPLLVLAVLGTLVAVIVATRNDDASPKASGPPSPSPRPVHSGGILRSAPAVGHDAHPTPDDTPYRTGTCLGGTIPDSRTPVSVKNVNVVACGSSDAHYRVIETFHGTTDLNRCKSNTDTQYAYSSERTLGGRTISSIVYCLVGLGSYAR
ncbi:LppU/SCO3897 family protein [Streptomyces griseocarneus]|uniref:LppU/SCO3897 family protein n=1 Tax=Streptomyces griseocarneus TaxID=51201 RepID=UPI00167D4DBE|nr:hypothetical protein [Streptomyces griseocarneus]MBZ6475166.1 hypothetical protein [Streptomyces griseocarneus]